MLKKLSFILFLFITYSSIAQEVQIEWSPNIPNNKQIIPSGARDGKTYATYLTKEGQLSGLIYGKDMVEEFNAPIAINIPGPKTKLEQTIFLKDKIVFVLCDYKNMVDFDVYIASTDYNYKVLSQPNKISEVASRAGLNFHFYSHMINISPDSNRILFTKVIHPEDRSVGYNKFEYQIFDTNLSLLHKETLKTTSSENRYKFMLSDISNDGTVAILLAQYPDYKILTKANAIILYLVKNNTTTRIDVTDKGNNIDSHNAAIGFDKMNNLYLVGILIESKKYSKENITKHVNIIKYNCNEMKIDTNYNFNSSIFYSSPSLIKNKERLKMRLEHMDFNKNNELCIVMAQHDDIMPGIRSPHHLFYQGNIAILTLNQNGSPKWHTKIPRLNLKSEEYNKIGIGADDIYLLRRLPNDHKIITEDNKFKYKNKSYKNLGLYLTTIKPNGTILNKKLYNFKDYKYEPDMNNIIFTKPNRFIMNTRFNTGIITVD